MWQILLLNLTRWAYNSLMPLEGFHPTIRKWFASRFGEPTEPQKEGWPKIQEGSHTLISAPTGTGKTIAGYLSAIDKLARQGDSLKDQTQVLYISPLLALSNDVQKNLQGPLAEIRQLIHPFRLRFGADRRYAGDRSCGQATQAAAYPGDHTESFYILLTSRGGREMLKTVKTVIVDEIHALARDKRGSHLALSLERLEVLAGPFQRIGLSATQKPLSEVAKFLVGVGRECELVDVGHRREMDIEIVVPPSPLSTICAHEQWDEIYKQIAELINQHRTTLVFVNTRKLAERITARLCEVMGEDQVTCHHSSLSRQRRLDAEHRLKSGTLKALVATASLVGIDIGEVDLGIQVGATPDRDILQRVGGRACDRRIPKADVSLTVDELIEAQRCFGQFRGDLIAHAAGRALHFGPAVVAACVERAKGWRGGTAGRFRRARPYRELTRKILKARGCIRAGAACCIAMESASGSWRESGRGLPRSREAGRFQMWPIIRSGPSRMGCLWGR